MGFVGNHSIWWVYGNAALTTKMDELRTTFLCAVPILIILIEIIWCDMAICFSLCIRMRMNAYRTLVHIFPMKWSSHTTFKSNVCVCVWRNVHDSMRAENTQNHLLHSSVRLLVGSECVETCEMIHEWRTWNENSMICCHIFRNWNVNKVEALATRCRLGGSSSISGSCDRYILGCFRNPCVFSCWLLSVFAGSWTNDTRIFEQFYHCYLDVSSFFIGLLWLRSEKWIWRFSLFGARAKKKRIALVVYYLQFLDEKMDHLIQVFTADS